MRLFSPSYRPFDPEKGLQLGMKAIVSFDEIHLRVGEQGDCLFQNKTIKYRQWRIQDLIMGGAEIEGKQNCLQGG